MEWINLGWLGGTIAVCCVTMVASECHIILAVINKKSAWETDSALGSETSSQGKNHISYPTIFLCSRLKALSAMWSSLYLAHFSFSCLHDRTDAKRGQKLAWNYQRVVKNKVCALTKDQNQRPRVHGQVHYPLTYRFIPHLIPGSMAKYAIY